MRIIVLLTLLSASVYGQGWTDLTRTKLTSVCPSPAPPGATGCAAEVGTWSGAIADTLRNRLVIWGGGHNDYYGNEVYALYLTGPLPSGTGVVCSNATAPAMCRLNNPSPPASNTNAAQAACVNALSDGAANSRHTYGGLAYISSADQMLAFGGTHSCAFGGKITAICGRFP